MNTMGAAEAAALAYSCERACDTLAEATYRAGAAQLFTRADISTLEAAAGVLARVRQAGYNAERAAIAAAMATSSPGEGERDD